MSIKAISNDTGPYPLFQSLDDVYQPFKGILLDAYGVFWSGNDVGLLPGSKQVMERLIAHGKTVGILSNSTQLSTREEEKLKTHGLIRGQHFHFLLTSGEMAKYIFSNEQLPFESPKKKFYLFGKVHPKFSSHESLFKDSPFKETADVDEADFIYISIPHLNGEDQSQVDPFRNDIEGLLEKNIPMVCANPDRYAHEGNPPKPIIRQGSIAALYEELGGQVFYIGKPSPLAFSQAMNHFHPHKITDPKEVLMVGDNPETDIRGARRFGMSSALVTHTGMMADRISHLSFDLAIEKIPPTDFPDFFIKRLGNP